MFGAVAAEHPVLCRGSQFGRCRLAASRQLPALPRSAVHPLRRPPAAISDVVLLWLGRLFSFGPTWREYVPEGFTREEGEVGSTNYQCACMYVIRWSKDRKKIKKPIVKRVCSFCKIILKRLDHID